VPALLTTRGTAALPDDEGALPAGACRERSECLLHPGHAQSGRSSPTHTTPSSARAPLRLSPPHRAAGAHQVAADGTSLPLVRTVSASDPVRLAVGVNAGLELHPQHIQKLGICNAASADRLQSRLHDRHGRRTLHRPGPRQCLLLLPRRGGEGTGVGAPRLLLLAILSGIDNPCYAADLDARDGWEHHPLVIVNGCKTARLPAGRALRVHRQVRP
jgi:hypothetical protein